METVLRREVEDMSLLREKLGRVLMHPNTYHGSVLLREKLGRVLMHPNTYHGFVLLDI